MTEEVSWARSVWERTSGFIHFTDVHMFAGLRAVDDDTRGIEMFLGPTDDHLDEKSWEELLAAFQDSSRLTLSLIDSWCQHKERLEPGIPKDAAT